MNRRGSSSEAGPASATVSQVRPPSNVSTPSPSTAASWRSETSRPISRRRRTPKGEVHEDRGFVSWDRDP